jgi:hypothetical protein
LAGRGLDEADAYEKSVESKRKQRTYHEDAKTRRKHEENTKKGDFILTSSHFDILVSFYYKPELFLDDSGLVF